MKNKLISIFLLCATLLFSAELKTPVDPSDPTKTTSEIAKSKYNLDFKKQDGLFYKGYTEKMSGFYLDQLSWEGNKDMNQSKLIDYVKSINIKGYKMSKRSSGNLSIVYYVPQIFDIELKNGQIIKNAQGRIPQIDTFDVFDETGKERCYTYFVRYWLEDKLQWLDNESNNFDETPPLPSELVTFIELTK